MVAREWGNSYYACSQEAEGEGWYSACFLISPSPVSSPLVGASHIQGLSSLQLNLSGNTLTVSPRAVKLTKSNFLTYSTENTFWLSFLTSALSSMERVGSLNLSFTIQFNRFQQSQSSHMCKLPFPSMSIFKLNVKLRETQSQCKYILINT